MDSNIQQNDLFIIQKQFFAVISLKKFQWKKILVDCCDTNNGLAVQAALLSCTILHPLAAQQPPRLEYQIVFLKYIISHLEDNSAEVESAIYDEYCKKLNQPKNRFAYLSFFGDDPQTPLVTVEETVSFISDGTTGLHTWPAARVLAEFCAVHYQLFSGKTILELGCGSGLLGLSLINTCKPDKVILSDCHQSVLQLVASNVRLNSSRDSRTGFGTRVLVLDLLWEDVSDEVVSHLSADVVLAADVIYDQSAVVPLVSALKKLSRLAKIIYIACVVRNLDTFSAFCDFLCRSDGHFTELEIPLCDNFLYTSDAPLKLIKITF